MCDWLASVLRIVPRGERGGATLARGPCWKVTAPKHHDAFVRQLRDLLPAGSILYLEGGSPSAKLRAILEALAVEPQLKIALGTIWPRPLVLHIPATDENVVPLAGLFGKHATPEICVHFHAYWEREVVLQWHDAFGHDPLYLSCMIPEARVRAFSERRSCSFELLPPGP
jgi:hypothetical protein